MPDELALLPLRDTVLFPHSILPLAAGRASSLKLIEDADARRTADRQSSPSEIRRPRSRRAATSTGRDARHHPQGAQAARRHRPPRRAGAGARSPGGGDASPSVSEGAGRGVPVEALPPAGDLETEALVRNASTLFRQIVALSPLLPDELASVIQNVSEPGRLADVIAASLPALSDQGQAGAPRDDRRQGPARRDSSAALTKEAEVLELGSKIQSQVESEVGKSQREFYLREQLKAIQKELGQTDDRAQELDELRQKIEAAGMTEEAQKEALRELDRLSKMPPAAAEYTVARTYLDWLVALPWSKETTDNLDIAQARDGPRRGPLGAREGQGPHPRVPRGEEHAAGRQGSDPLLRRAAGRRQDVARPLHRSGPRSEVPPHLARRHARRGGDPRPPADLHRRAARARSSRGCGGRSPRIPCSCSTRSTSSGWISAATPPRRCSRCSIPSRTSAFRDHYVDVAFDLSKILFITTANVLDPVPSGASRPDGDHRDRGLHRRGEDPHRPASTSCPSRRGITGSTDADIRWSEEALRASRPELHARGRTPQSRAGDRRGDPEDHQAPGRGPRRTRRGQRGDWWASLLGRAQISCRGTGGAHPRARGGRGSRLDADRRRHPVHRGDADEGEQDVDPDRPARRRDEGIGPAALSWARSHATRSGDPLGLLGDLRSSTSTSRPGRFPRTARRPA